MATINTNYDKLAAGYLFPEIAKRAKAFQIKNPVARILRLGIGNTTEPLTPMVIDGLMNGVRKLASVDTYTGYGDGEGDIRLRKALSDRYKNFGVDLEADEIFVSDGSKPDAGNIQSIFGNQNIVAVQDPAYPVYVDSNVMAGRTGRFNPEKSQYEGIVYMPCTEANGFFPDLPKQKVDMIYLCSPNNPTGAVATREQLARFVEYAKEHKSVIIFDAAYSDFIRQGDLPRSIFEVPGAKECAIEINSFSKIAGFTGVRLGWCVVPKSLVVEGVQPGKINGMWNRRQNTLFNGASNIVQEGGIAALSPKGCEECRQLVDYYLKNAITIKEALVEMGFKAFGGENAPYIWLKTPNGMGSWDFFDRLLNQAHVVGTPGVGFGPSGEGYFRLSAFGHQEDIQAAVESIRAKLVL
jgi:LL-diaminopimelate aminotransferase